MLQTFLQPKLDNMDTEPVRFQKDGDRALKARRSLKALKKMFRRCLISLRDFFCFFSLGYLKN